jgi:outer membrane protein assembly factor BamB
MMPFILLNKLSSKKKLKAFFKSIVCDIIHKVFAITGLSGLNVSGKRNAIRILLSGIIATSLFLTPFVAAQELISIPSDYIRELQMPGALNHFLRPARILTDNKQNEIYVADAGNDRIVIFDQKGYFKFEFSTSEQCGAPIDVAVDSNGHVFVLGATSSGSGVFEYDYNGAFIRQFIEDSLIAQSQISSIAIDNFNRLYLVDSRGKRIMRTGIDGNIEKEFPASPDLTGNLLRDASYGILSISKDIIYLPVSSIGTVYCFDLDGNFLKTIGYLGTQVGELNFPVAAATIDDNTILVLDKHRFDVACFTTDGEFIGEFGGKGASPGWFYHPNWLAVDNNGLIYIGQIFNNKIQVCRMPAPILERRQKMNDSKIIKEKSLNGSDDQTGQILNRKSPAKSLVIFNINQHNGGLSHA